MAFLERPVNGQPGLVAELDGVIVTVFAFDVAACDHPHLGRTQPRRSSGRWTAG